MCRQFLYFSFITVTFVIEAMASANAIVRREYLQQMKRVSKWREKGCLKEWLYIKALYICLGRILLLLVQKGKMCICGQGGVLSVTGL